MSEASETSLGESTAQACAVCGFVVEGVAPGASGVAICDGCSGRQAAASGSGAPRLPLALAGGAVGALVGAGVWAAIAVFTNFEVGYVAVLVGYLAGLGVRLGAGGARGKALQVMAAGLALGGLVVAKYFTFAHFFAQMLAEEGIQAGPFHPEILTVFPRALPEMLSPFDLLWVALAMATAWKAPAKP